MHSNTELAQEHALWREAFSIQDAKTACRSDQVSDPFTCAVLCTGGCLCTVSAIRADFKIIWGTEICPKHKTDKNNCSHDCTENRQQRMWMDLTGAPCLGNTFSNPTKYDSLPTPDYLTSGQPCPDYSRSGSKLGANGKTGWMFVQQTDIILRIKPKIFRLEISDHALHINGGKEVEQVIDSLSPAYNVKWKLLKVSEFGDPTNRIRLIIIGTLLVYDKSITEDISFTFPEVTCDPESQLRIRDTAVPDSAVPESYWLDTDPKRTVWKEPQCGKIHLIARSGPGMGQSYSPNAVQSWESIANTQTTFGGGGVRPMLGWTMGRENKIGPTRKTVPIEAVRWASHSDSLLPWIEGFTTDLQQPERDMFTLMCVNNGIPQRTCYALDREAITWLRRIKFRLMNFETAISNQGPMKSIADCTILQLSMRANHQQSSTAMTLRTMENMAASWATHAELYDHSSTEISDTRYCNTVMQSDVRSAMLDTGANVSLMQTECEVAMNPCTDSKIRIEVADTRYMSGVKDGTLHMRVLQMSRKAHDNSQSVHLDTGITLSHKVTTAADLSRELFSIDDMYAVQGCSILLRAPDYESGISEIYFPESAGRPSYCIPLRYDYENGGFWLDYTLSQSAEQHRSTTHYGYSAVMSPADHQIVMSEAALSPCYSEDEAILLVVQLSNCEAVTGTDLHHCLQCYAAPASSTDQHSEATDTNIRGVKAGLRTNKKQMTVQEFHDEYGHLGCVGPCIICTLSSGCMRSITKAVDAHVENRRAHTWDGDILTWEHRSECGSKYQVVIRDRMSKAFEYLFLGTRAEAPDAFRIWINSERRKPEYQDMGYQFCTILHLDRAGEWGPDSGEWKQLSEDLKFETRWTSPDSKKEASHAERGVGISEVTTKALLLQRALHHTWWVRCAVGAKFLLNHFPTTTTRALMPTDGDQARPIELLTGGYISRRQCDRELSYWVAPGTPALVHDHKAKGSQMDRLKSSWKVAWGMYREQVIWWSPWTRAISHSKSYTAFKLNRGVSFIQWLNLTGLSELKRSADLPGDFNEKVVIKFPALPADVIDNAKKAVAMRQPLLTVKHSTELQDNPAVFNTYPTVTIDLNLDTAGQELGGSVTAIDSNGNLLKVDNDTGELYAQDPGIAAVNTSNRTLQATRPFVFIESINRSDKYQTHFGMMQDETDAQAAAVNSYTTNLNDRFVRVCKDVLRLPFQYHHLYHKWLIDTVKHRDGRRFTAEDLPLDRGINMKPGIMLPLPTGSYWRRLIAPLEAEKDTLQDLNDTLTAMSVHHVINEIKSQDFDLIKSKGKMTFAAQQQVSLEQHDDHDTSSQIVRSIAYAAGIKRTAFDEAETRHIVSQIKESARRVCTATHSDEKGNQLQSLLCVSEHAINPRSDRFSVEQPTLTANSAATPARSADTIDQCRARAREYSIEQRAHAVKRQKAIAAGSIPPPRSTKEALERDPKGWSDSIQDEFGGLLKMGVLDEGTGSLGYTKAQLLKEGIDISRRGAVYVGLYHTHKFDKDGSIDRLKTRCALKGHKGNMQRGNHFTETFTPTPREDTARILTALTAVHNLQRLTGDIEKAYCWAPLPPGDLIAVRYPPGLKKFHSETKEEMYMILRKNLYGHPAAGRAWGELRDSEILKYFNTGGWTCVQQDMDPCFFYFTRGTDWALASIHTDDVDAAGTTSEILAAIFSTVDKIWKVKMTDPEYMLGIRRQVYLDTQGKVDYIELTMEPYIRGMADTFRDHLPKRTIRTPFPEKLVLSKHNKPEESEIRHYQQLGYNRAVGMVVWAVRHVMPACKFGVSQLCGVMAVPGKDAWDAVMHMIAYIEQHCTQGIKFTASSSAVPVGMVDASNKPDPFDGICYAGFVLFMAGGPIIAKSFKLKHVGLSSEHNEYMGLTAALRAVVWLRQLLQQIGQAELVTNPTTIYGDNIQANRLCKEHFVTTGNQHIYLPYHWNRECIAAGMAVVKWVQTKANVSDVLSKAVQVEVMNSLGALLCGYGNLQAFIDLLEASPRLWTDDNHKLGGVSRKY
jgi:site-specific DNA-cytosine methylase